MTKQTTSSRVQLQVRIEPELKAQAEKVLDTLGLDISTAVRMFLIQTVKANGLPFTVNNNPAENRLSYPPTESKNPTKKDNRNTKS